MNKNRRQTMNKNIVLGISSSISAYKAPSVVSGLKKIGCH